MYCQCTEIVSKVFGPRNFVQGNLTQRTFVQGNLTQNILVQGNLTQKKAKTQKFDPMVKEPKAFWFKVNLPKR